MCFSHLSNKSDITFSNSQRLLVIDSGTSGMEMYVGLETNCLNKLTHLQQQLHLLGTPWFLQFLQLPAAVLAP
jgi:hypothetical protein